MFFFISPLLITVLVCSCDNENVADNEDVFTVDVLNGMTPVKDQGRSSLCWAYAMLATIESEHIMQGDSVNLSVAYIARKMLLQEAERYYFAQGRDTISLRGVAPMLIDMIEEYGIMPYEAYHSDCNFNVVSRKVAATSKGITQKRRGLPSLNKSMQDLLDDIINPVPNNVYMFSVRYTPIEFAHSVCMKDEYVALTSFTHKPFYEDIILSLPDNKRGYKFYNVPIDTLVDRVENAIQSGHCVCWEGDITEPGFSFERGTARLESGTEVTQEARQRTFEDFSTTDDHCMEIVGLAHDDTGAEYFICKNSWGTNNPYKGLMYMSLDYFRLKTILAVLAK
ncbi:MAG: cysteine protease [Prevotella sp.]|nr:cysteine protease [Prevotella sp.]